MGVPNNIIIPFVAAEFDSSFAASGPAEIPFAAFLFGQKNDTGTEMTDGVQYLVTSDDEVGRLAGYGSNLHRLAIKWFKNNRVSDLVVMSIPDAVGATASVVIVAFTGTATEDGELPIYIDGDRYAAPVSPGDTNDDSGAILETEINGDSSCSMTAVYVTGTLTLTAKSKGLEAGEIPVELNYNDGERTPAGFVVSVGAPTAGGGTPDVGDALDNIGDKWFQVLAASYNDSTNLTLIETFLAERAGVMIQKDGMYYTGMRGTRSEMITFSTSGNRNSPYVSLYACTDIAHSIADIVGAIAGRTAESVQDDPAVPLHRMTLTGLLPKKETDRWDAIERNQLAKSGIATLTHDNGVQTEASVTMYLENSAGASDIAYQYQNTIFILQRLRYRFVNRILSKYPRAKLANSSERIRTGQQVMTPTIGRAEAVAWFLEEELDGQVENLKQFKAELVVARDATNVNRLNWLLPPDLINQFIIGSADLQFRLQSSN